MFQPPQMVPIFFHVGIQTQKNQQGYCREATSFPFFQRDCTICIVVNFYHHILQNLKWNYTFYVLVPYPNCQLVSKNFLYFLWYFLEIKTINWIITEGWLSYSQNLSLLRTGFVPTYRFQLWDVPAEILRDVHHLIYDAVHLLDTRDNDISNNDKKTTVALIGVRRMTRIAY